MKLKIVLASFCMLLGISLSAQDAREIIRKADAKLKGQTSYAEMSIQVVRPSWTREMSMKSWSKGSAYFLVLVTAPAKEKGSVTLKRNKEVWSWMPSIDRTIKLPPSMMSQSWMGTDFTNDDLVRQSSIIEDYTHKLLGEESIQGRQAYKIELTPKPDAPVVWGKIRFWIDKTEYMQLKAEYYDEDGELVNVMLGYDFKSLGGKMLPSRIEMIPMDKKGQKTVILYKIMEFDKPVDDSFFSTQNMTRVK